LLEAMSLQRWGGPILTKFSPKMGGPKPAA